MKHIPRAVKRRAVRRMYNEHPEYVAEGNVKGGPRGYEQAKGRGKGKKKDRENDGAIQFDRTVAMLGDAPEAPLSTSFRGHMGPPGALALGDMEGVLAENNGRKKKRRKIKRVREPRDSDSDTI